MRTPCRLRAAAISLAFLSVLAAAPARADSESANRPHVIQGDGPCHARSVPKARWGMVGTIRVYAGPMDKGRLIGSHNWYVRRLYLRCRITGGKLRTAMVRFGPWQRGRRASHGHLAIAFYRDGKLLRRYSTLTIAGRPNAVRASVSHYRVIRRVLGPRPGNRFAIETVNGETIAFDMASGRRLPSR